MFLTNEQLQELTGYKTGRKQSAWLVENGYSFDRRSDGRPMVLIAQLVERQCRRTGKTATRPDFSWMK